MNKRISIPNQRCFAGLKHIRHLLHCSFEMTLDIYRNIAREIYSIPSPYRQLILEQCPSLSYMPIYFSSDGHLFSHEDSFVNEAVQCGQPAFNVFEKYIKIDMTVILSTMYRLITPSLPFFPQNALRHASQMADLRKMWKSNSHTHCPTSPCKTLDPSLNISWLTDSKALAFSLPQCQNKTTLKCFLSVDLYSNDALCKDGNFLFTGYMSWGHI